MEKNSNRSDHREMQRSPNRDDGPPETRRQQLSNGDGRNRDEIEREREIESLRERLESER